MVYVPMKRRSASVVIEGLRAYQGDTSASLVWDPVPGAVGYEVECIELASSVEIEGGEPGGAFVGLTNGEVYTFRVRAMFPDDVLGPWSGASNPVMPLWIFVGAPAWHWQHTTPDALGEITTARGIAVPFDLEAEGEGPTREAAGLAFSADDEQRMVLDVGPGQSLTEPHALWFVASLDVESESDQVLGCFGTPSFLGGFSGLRVIGGGAGLQAFSGGSDGSANALWAGPIDADRHVYVVNEEGPPEARVVRLYVDGVEVADSGAPVDVGSVEYDRVCMGALHVAGASAFFNGVLHAAGVQGLPLSAGNRAELDVWSAADLPLAIP